MSEDTKARLEIIDDTIEFDETVTHDVRALLLDPGAGLKKREAEGYLVLTNRRLIFGTARHGILVDVARKEVAPPASVTYRGMMARLTIETREGIGRTFVVNKQAARDIAFAINQPQAI